MRTFIAIDFDDTIKRRLATIQDRLGHTCPELRWVAPEKIHLTLKFLGELEEAQIEPIARALDQLADQCRPFDIAVRGVGAFGPPASVRTVWVGLHEVEGALARCHTRCEDLLEPLGIARERRPFRPHLTLARNRAPGASRRIRHALEKYSGMDVGTQPVASITFYESTLTSRGPIYRPLGRHPFRDGSC